VISQGKVVALDRWGGKWNHLSMTHRLTSIYAKNYCNRTLIIKVIVENVVTSFFGDTVYMCRNGRWSVWSQFDVNRSTLDEDISRERFSHFRSQWPWPLTSLVTLFPPYVSTKFVSAAFLLHRNRRTDRRTGCNT